MRVGLMYYLMYYHLTVSKNLTDKMYLRVQETRTPNLHLYLSRKIIYEQRLITCYFNYFLRVILK